MFEKIKTWKAKREAENCVLLETVVLALVTIRKEEEEKKSPTW
jgi:hypothetical protein